MKVLGLINSKETSYRSEVKRLMEWCRSHILFLNVKKTKEMVVDYRKNQQHAPLYINGTAVERVISVISLGPTWL